MVRRLVLAGLLMVVAVGVGVVAQPAAATPDPHPDTTDTLSSTDTQTTDRTATDPTPSNRTAAGNAHRPAGPDPFETTAATTDGSGPGFGPVLAALALAALAVLAARRN